MLSLMKVKMRYVEEKTEPPRDFTSNTEAF